MNKSRISWLIALALCVGLMSMTAMEVSAQTVITDRTKLKGMDYTQSSELARVLETIFDGNISVYHDSNCTDPVDARIGTSNFKNNGVSMYVGPLNGPWKNAGTSCWIYGNGVYYTLFGDVVYNKDGGSNSETLSLSGGSGTYVTYSNFVAWGVHQGVGAMVRANNHSWIVLGYDADALTVLDGNGDGRGLVAVRVKPWSEVDSTKVEYIVQPKESFLNAKYPNCQHLFENTEICSLCNYRYVYTINTADSGVYRIVSNFNPCTDGAFETAEKDTVTLKAGETVDVIGSLINAKNIKWYLISYNGKTGYVHHENLSFLNHGTQQITCTLTAPAEGETVPKQSYAVKGTVASQYPLNRVEAYLDGILFATVKGLGQYSINIQKTDINYGLSFFKLSPGRHTLVIMAHDIHRSQPEVVLTRNFYTEGEVTCEHSWKSATCITPNVCLICSVTEGTALGHSMGQWTITCDPTNTSDGERIRKCSRNGCDYSETEKISASGSKNGWVKESGKWYYYENSEKLTAQWLLDGGVWYYLDSEGMMATGWKSIGGKWYFFSENGAMQTGWQKIDGKWYYLKSEMKTGWQKIDGKWYYLKSEMKTGWQYIGGKWYYLGSNGAMKTGWQSIAGKWYYLNSSGVMQTGWLLQSGKWYYLDATGVMVTGIHTVDGVAYTFNSSGVWIP